MAVGVAPSAAPPAGCASAWDAGSVGAAAGSAVGAFGSVVSVAAGGAVVAAVVVSAGVVSVAGAGAGSCAEAGSADPSATAAVAKNATPRRPTAPNRFPLAANGVSSGDRMATTFLPQFPRPGKRTLAYERPRGRRGLSFLWIYERGKQKSARLASIGSGIGCHERFLSARVGFARKPFFRTVIVVHQGDVLGGGLKSRAKVRWLGAAGLMSACLVALPGQAMRSTSLRALASATRPSSEGGTATFTVTLSVPDPVRSRDVKASTADGSARGHATTPNGPGRRSPLRRTTSKKTSPFATTQDAARSRGTRRSASTLSESSERDTRRRHGGRRRSRRRLIPDARITRCAVRRRGCAQRRSASASRESTQRLSRSTSRRRRTTDRDSRQRLRRAATGNVTFDPGQTRPEVGQRRDAGRRTRREQRDFTVKLTGGNQSDRRRHSGHRHDRGHR